MQPDYEEGSTPPPPYTPIDNLNSSSNIISPNIIQPHQFGNIPLNTSAQYHSQDPYPATVIPGDPDFRLAQKLQDQEYTMWIDQNQIEEHFNPSRGTAGESSAFNPARPRISMPPIPEHYPCNYHPQYQNAIPSSRQQYPIVYASPNQPPLPYSQTAPYGSSTGLTSDSVDLHSSYYGSLTQGGSYSSTNHPFNNAPYHQHFQQQQSSAFRSEEEEDYAPGCLAGLYELNYHVWECDQGYVYACMGPVCLFLVLYLHSMRIEGVNKREEANFHDFLVSSLFLCHFS
ncbi:hypothetical protein G9A89_009993 [Geosiphon pyriformis]|nr:hypothetical protein G9A89_009993 [Geosiphon pyriformis]